MGSIRDILLARKQSRPLRAVQVQLAAVRAGAPEKGRMRIAHAAGLAVTIVEDPAKHASSRSPTCSHSAILRRSLAFLFIVPIFRKLQG